ncbi:DUF1840 domain-containing protein, partial [Pseudomonas sp. MWU13-2625]
MAAGNAGPPARFLSARFRDRRILTGANMPLRRPASARP